MPDEAKKGAEPYEMIGALIATARLHRKHAEHVVSETCLHPTQHRVLMYLSRRGTPCLQREISEEFELTPAAVAQIVDKLEKCGYVARVTPENDGRCKHVSLTKAGEGVVTESLKAFREIDARTFSGISEKELAVFRGILSRMQENLK